MKTWSLGGFFVLSLILASEATRPGIIIRVNNKGLQYVDSVGIQVLIQKLKTTTIKDFKGDADTPLGHIVYELTNLHNTGASISSSSFKTDPGVGLTLQASGVYVAFNGHWHYRKKHWPHVSDSGSFDVSASGVSFSLSARLGEIKGHPSISTASCSANINDVKVKFHGGASWLYNLFRGKIADSLKDQLKSKICVEVTKGINEDAEKELSTFPVRKQIDKFAIIDYSFIDYPLFTAHYLNVSLKGEFMSAAHPTEATIQPVEIPGSQPCNKMICLYLTDYVANTAGEVYFKGGFLNRTVKASQIYDMYPDQALQLQLYCTKAPQVNAQSTGLSLVLDGIVEVYVVMKDSSTKFLFSLETNITGTGEVNVNGTVLQGSISKFGVECGVAKSAVGDIKPNIVLLNLYLHFIGKYTIIKELNERGKKGLPLPVLDNIHLLNTQILLGKHFISLDTDLKYILESHTKNYIPILP